MMNVDIIGEEIEKRYKNTRIFDCSRGIVCKESCLLFMRTLNNLTQKLLKLLFKRFCPLDVLTSNNFTDWDMDPRAQFRVKCCLLLAKGPN